MCTWCHEKWWYNAGDSDTQAVNIKLVRVQSVREADHYLVSIYGTYKYFIVGHYSNVIMIWKYPIKGEENAVSRNEVL